MPNRPKPSGTKYFLIIVVPTIDADDYAHVSDDKHDRNDYHDENKKYFPRCTHDLPDNA